MASVEVNLPNVPQGANVSIPYLGRFKNGETTEVSERNWGRWLRNHPGAREPQGGVLRLTREGLQEAHEERMRELEERDSERPDESQEGTEPPPGEDPTEHSPQQTEGDSLEKPVDDEQYPQGSEQEPVLIDLNEEG